MPTTGLRKTPAKARPPREPKCPFGDNTPEGDLWWGLFQARQRSEAYRAAFSAVEIYSAALFKLTGKKY